MFRTIGTVECDRWLGPSDETHAGTVIRQHSDGTCDVRLPHDPGSIVLRAHVQPAGITLDSETCARRQAYDDDARNAADRAPTEGDAHVSYARHATLTAMVNEGASGGSERQHDDD